MRWMGDPLGLYFPMFVNKGAQDVMLEGSPKINYKISKKFLIDSMIIGDSKVEKYHIIFNGEPLNLMIEPYDSNDSEDSEDSEDSINSEDSEDSIDSNDSEDSINLDDSEDSIKDNEYQLRYLKIMSHTDNFDNEGICTLNYEGSKLMISIKNKQSEWISTCLLNGWKTMCANCKNEKSKMLMCSRCMCVEYCGNECQKNDWMSHKIICNKIANKKVFALE